MTDFPQRSASSLSSPFILDALPAAAIITVVSFKAIKTTPYVRTLFIKKIIIL